MALNLVSPGVKVREVDLTVGRIDGINDQVGAIAGPFERGPVNEPVLFLHERKCRVCGKTYSLTEGFYLTRKNRGEKPSSYSYECKTVSYTHLRAHETV